MNIAKSPILADFRWTRKRVQAAMSLAEGQSINEAAKEAGISERTLYRWRHDIDFGAEVDRLSLMLGIAIKAERVRIAKRAVRQMVREELDPDTGKYISIVHTDRDLLDWLKYVQGETEGIRLDLTNLLASYTNNFHAPVNDPSVELSGDNPD